jgi:hypothetical protein
MATSARPDVPVIPDDHARTLKGGELSVDPSPEAATVGSAPPNAVGESG